MKKMIKVSSLKQLKTIDSGEYKYLIPHNCIDEAGFVHVLRNHGKSDEEVIEFIRSSAGSDQEPAVIDYLLNYHSQDRQEFVRQLNQRHKERTGKPFTSEAEDDSIDSRTESALNTALEYIRKNCSRPALLAHPSFADGEVTARLGGAPAVPASISRELEDCIKSVEWSFLCQCDLAGEDKHGMLFISTMALSSGSLGAETPVKYFEFNNARDHKWCTHRSGDKIRENELYMSACTDVSIEPFIDTKIYREAEEYDGFVDACDELEVESDGRPWLIKSGGWPDFNGEPNCINGCRGPKVNLISCELYDLNNQPLSALAISYRCSVCDMHGVTLSFT